ncbi:MAG: glycosyltransferase family 4 protein [Bacteroidia bacterium]
MRIGIEAQRIFRPKKHGMDIVVLEVIKQLQKIESEHEYIVFVKDDEDNNCLQESHNVKIVKVAGKTYVDWEQISLPKAVKKHKIDLLHCTSNTAPFFVKVPTVITLHDIIYLEKIEFTGTAYQNFGNVYRKYNVPSVIRKCKKVITVSEYEKERIIDHLKQPSDKVVVAYNGLSDAFKVYDDAILEPYRAEKNLPKKYIFSLGNQAPKKNMKGSIKAYLNYLEKSNEKLPLVIVECTSEFLDSTLKEFNALQKRDYFHLTGYTPHAQLPYLYNLAHIYLYPSYRESFGIPILEGNACGVPVITSNTSSMPEVSGGSTLLINPNNIDEITNALLQIEQDESLRAGLIEKGLRNAAKFTWKNTALKTLEIYNEVLK